MFLKQRRDVNDGLGTDARFKDPKGVAVDSSGNVYVADYGNHIIRKIDSNGNVTTLAGQAGVTGSNDGQGADPSSDNQGQRQGFSIHFGEQSSSVQ